MVAGVGWWGSAVSDASRGYRQSKLGSLRARPRIVAFYTSADGWQDGPRPLHRLTDESAAELLAEGIHLVRVRHRFRTIDIRLHAYLPQSSSAPGRVSEGARGSGVYAAGA